MTAAEVLTPPTRHVQPLPKPSAARLPRLRHAVVRIAVVVAVLCLWQVLASQNVVAWLRFDTIPSVTETWKALAHSLSQAAYFTDVAQSVIRILTGFLIAVAVGVPVGIALGRSALARASIGTLVELVRPIPAIALVPIAILVFPADEPGIVFITAAAAFFPIVVSTRHAVRALPTIWEESIRTQGGSGLDVLRYVVLPGILPGLFGGMSVGMGVSWICLISAEMISGQLGIGYRTWQAYTVVDYPNVIVGMLTIGALGFVTSAGIERLGRRVTRWLPRSEGGVK